MVLRERAKKRVKVGCHFRILWNVIKQTILNLRVPKLYFCPSLPLFASVRSWLNMTWVKIINCQRLVSNFLWLRLGDVCLFEVILRWLTLLNVTYVYQVTLGPIFIILRKQFGRCILWLHLISFLHLPVLWLIGLPSVPLRQLSTMDAY